MKRILSFFAWPVLLFLFISQSVTLASAASYDVSASVNFPAPTQAATIDPALDNLTVQDAAFVISGTCQVMSPAVVISVWRGSTTLGSQSCASGTYSLQISLAEGANALIVKSASVSALYGPDSTPISVTLHTPLPPAAPPQNPPTSSPPTPGSTNLSPADNTAFNNGAQSGLSIVPQEPFSVLPPSKEISLSFYIGGGSSPYSVELNWGDGTTETKVVDKPGLYTFTHLYRNAGNYIVKGRVKDVLGAVTEISHSVVIKNPLDIPKITAALNQPKNNVRTWLSHHWVGTTVGVAVAGVAAGAYLLGQSAATQAAAAQAANNPKGKSVRKTAKPKPKGKR